MRNNYLILCKPQWVSNCDGYPPIKIKGTLKIFTHKNNNFEYDRRTKEVKRLMKEKPKYYQGIWADVKIT